MSTEQITVRQWQENYRAGAYNGRDIETQRAAGWRHWCCRGDALAGRLRLIAPVILGVSDPLILDNYFISLTNNIGQEDLIYDCAAFRPADGEIGDIPSFEVRLGSPGLDRWTLYTERFGFRTPEFSCGHVQDMTKYIDAMAPELEQGVRPAILDEKQAVMEYILFWNSISPLDLRREGEHSYSFLDRDDGRRKTVHVAARLENAPPGFQAEGSVRINRLYVSCPDDRAKEAVILPPKKSHKKKEAER